MDPLTAQEFVHNHEWAIGTSALGRALSLPTVTLKDLPWDRLEVWSVAVDLANHRHMGPQLELSPSQSRPECPHHTRIRVLAQHLRWQVAGGT